MIDRTKLAARTPVRAAKTPSSDAVAAQQTQFDEQMEERAELLREANAMRDMMLAQLKDDDETLKKYIAMI
jgi:hypothetical protein